MDKKAAALRSFRLFCIATLMGAVIFALITNMMRCSGGS